MTPTFGVNLSVPRLSGLLVVGQDLGGFFLVPTPGPLGPMGGRPL